MTLPDERYRAVRNTEQFLLSLCKPSETARVPRSVREQARSLLRHYPSAYDLDRLAESRPDILTAEMETLARWCATYEEAKRNDHAS